MYDVGDSATLNFSLTDSAGAPANGTVVLTVTKPDGSTLTPTPSNPATGSYTAAVTLDQAGRWAYRWVSTGAVTAAQSDVLDVSEATPTALVSLVDVKAHLNITSTTNDEELRRFIDAATDFIESKIGPVVRRTITQTVWPQDGLLEIRPPVLSLTSVTAAYGYSATYNVANLFVDTDTGIIRYGPYAATFAYPVTVTYVAGRVVVPALVRQAALDYVKWLWESQRGPTPVPLPGGDLEVVTPATVPYKVTQSLEPYMRAASGVA